MTQQHLKFSVFTKPWKLPLGELASLVRRLGFDGIELPVRPGYQVEPQNVTRGLPEAARAFAEEGLSICSIAGPTDEVTLAACAECGVPIVRVCEAIPTDCDYMTAIEDLQRRYDGLVPLLDRYSVKLGVQNHFGRFVNNAMALHHLLAEYDPRNIAAVWDAAHNALCGEPVELALDIVWSHLCMVNLKNAFRRRLTGPEAEVVQWQPYWTTGRQGIASWPTVAAELKRRRWQGVVCLTAEYSDHSAVDRLIAEDIAFAREIFGC